jgi:hypothetical protein
MGLEVVVDEIKAKGDAASAKIIADANAEAVAIKADAQKRADEITAAAQKDAAEQSERMLVRETASANLMLSVKS